MKDIKNCRFGRLKALYPTARRDKKGSVYWHCICDCGNEIDVTEDGLVHGNYQSCGCLREEYRKNIYKQLHLTDGTCVEWLKSRKSRKDSHNDFRGVYKNQNGTYRVTIGFKRKRYQLGTYKSLDDAVKARLKAEHLIHDGFLEAYDKWEEKAKADPVWGEQHPLVFEVFKENGKLSVRTNIQM